MVTAIRQEKAQRGPTLFEVGDDLRALEDLLMEAGGDVSDEEAEAAIDAWLAEIHGAEAAKLDRYGWFRASLLARAQARREHAGRLAELAERDEKAAKRLENRLLAYMQMRGVQHLETEHFRFSCVRVGGKLPLQWLQDIAPEDLEPRFRRARVKLTVDAPGADELADMLERYGPEAVTLEPVNAAVREALEEGEDLPFAQLGERGTRLIVK